MSDEYLLKVPVWQLCDELTRLGLVWDGLEIAGSYVTISGPVTDQNRSMWEYLETGPMYKSHEHSRRLWCEENYVLVKSNPAFRSFYMDKVDLDKCYKVKMTLRKGHIEEVTPPDLFGFWKNTTDQLRTICSRMGLKTEGSKKELVSRLSSHIEMHA